MHISVTSKQREALKAVYALIRDNPMPPTVRELQACMGLSSSFQAHRFLLVLERKGLLRRRLGVNRSVTITREGLRLLGVDSVTLPVFESAQGDVRDSGERIHVTLPPQDESGFAGERASVVNGASTCHPFAVRLGVADADPSAALLPSDVVVVAPGAERERVLLLGAEGVLKLESVSANAVPQATSLGGAVMMLRRYGVALSI